MIFRMIIAALLIGIAAAAAQNGGAPRGDYDLYVNDRAAWEAKRAGTCITRDAVFDDTPLGRAAQICARRTWCSDDDRHSASAGGMSPKFVWEKDACEKVWRAWQAARFQAEIDTGKANDARRVTDEIADRKLIEEFAGSLK